MFSEAFCDVIEDVNDKLYASLLAELPPEQRDRLQVIEALHTWSMQARGQSALLPTSQVKDNLRDWLPAALVLLPAIEWPEHTDDLLAPFVGKMPIRREETLLRRQPLV